MRVLVSCFELAWLLSAATRRDAALNVALAVQRRNVRAVAYFGRSLCRCDHRARGFAAVRCDSVRDRQAQSAAECAVSSRCGRSPARAAHLHGLDLAAAGSTARA